MSASHSIDPLPEPVVPPVETADLGLILGLSLPLLLILITLILICKFKSQKQDESSEPIDSYTDSPYSSTESKS